MSTWFSERGEQGKGGGMRLVMTALLPWGRDSEPATQTAKRLHKMYVSSLFTSKSQLALLLVDSPWLNRLQQVV